MSEARTRAVMVVAAVLAVSVAACCEEGSGVMARETRPVGVWNRLSLDVPGSVRVVQGPATPLRIETDDNLMDRVVTRVRDGELEIGTDDDCCVDPTRLVVDVSAEEIRGLALDGSGAIVLPKPIDGDSVELSLDGSGSIEVAMIRAGDVSIDIDGSGQVDVVVDADRLRTSIDGSGDTLVAGSAGEHDISIDGSGDVEATSLETGSTRIEIDGSGGCAIAADQQLDVTIDGSGDVAYCGDPRVTQSIDGSGSVHQASASSCD
ncbi:MAG TPA: head GIN domain-containing protein [Kofleriaceae bacterium]|nr:head GIN domain-containing protein [Kofleriaceae bacterium]